MLPGLLKNKEWSFPWENFCANLPDICIFLFSTEILSVKVLTLTVSDFRQVTFKLFPKFCFKYCLFSPMRFHLLKEFTKRNKTHLKVNHTLTLCIRNPMPGERNDYSKVTYGMDLSQRLFNTASHYIQITSNNVRLWIIKIVPLFHIHTHNLRWIQLRCCLKINFKLERIILKLNFVFCC